MNILFITLADFSSVYHHGIYEDLIRHLCQIGHQVFVVSPTEGREGGKPHMICQGQASILKVKTGRVQKTGLIRKGLATLMLESQFKRAIKARLNHVKFDLVLYSTPPITFLKAVSYVKRRDGARTYLLLKDIFPQNAVDLGMLSQTGVKGLIYQFFRRKERRLYAVSDHIGCMSDANASYILKHNPELPRSRVSVCPNSIEVLDLSVPEEEKAALRAKYDLPADKIIFVYGGNLGRPQDVPFIVECLRAQRDNPDVFFLIAGSGTERGVLEAYMDEEAPAHVRLLKSLPKDEYDRMVACCHVGLLFLDHRFTIPNFPSRLLSYMQVGLPVLACTDPNTDVGQVIRRGEFGWWCESSSAQNFAAIIPQCLEDLRTGAVTGAAGHTYLKSHYSVESAARAIAQTWPAALTAEAADG